MVYSALDKRKNRRVAIKVASAMDMDNLRNEIAMQALSRHENVVLYEETFLHAGKLWVRVGAGGGGGGRGTTTAGQGRARGMA